MVEQIKSVSQVSPATTYCTVDDVELFLQITDRTSSTSPSKQDIEKMILWAENKIDRITHNSWKLNTVYNEYYDYKDFIEIRRIRYLTYPDYRGKIPLRHQHIRKMLSMNVWDGSSYVDFVTQYTEGRGNDYWIDYELGIVYFWSRYPFRIRNAMYVSYQWGEYEVPEDIREACIKIVARQLMTSDDYSVLLPEGSSNISQQIKTDIWKEDIDEILLRRKEVIYY